MSDDTSKKKDRSLTLSKEAQTIINARQATKGYSEGSILFGRASLVDGLKKTKNFCTSMATITKKKDFDEQEIDRVQHQLAEALSQVEQLTIEQEKALAITEFSSNKAEELKAMLAESAKENALLHERFGVLQSELVAGRGEVEHYKRIFEEVFKRRMHLRMN